MAAAAAALGAEIFSRGFRFQPTPQDAVSYYLPRLVAGEPLHDAVRPVVHRADVYAAACAPADLARRFRPLPKTGDRFFFTPSAAASRKRAGGGAAARAGSWHAQSTVDIKVHRRGGYGDGDGDAKVGELRKLRYKKSGGVYTDWLMDEYSSCSCSVAAGEFALCKMYVSPRASPASAAHKESAAYFFQLLPVPPQRADVVMPAAPAAAVAAPKWPAPPPQPAAMSPPCSKRMRGPAALPPPPPPPRPPAPPVAARHAAQLHRSPLPLPLPTPRRPLAKPKKEEVPWLPTPPVAMASASDMPQQAPAPAPPPCPPQVFVVQPKQRMTTVNPFEASMLREEEETVAAAAPHPTPPTATPTPALQDEDDDWDDLDKALLGIDDATPGLQDQDQDNWDDLDKLLGI